MVLKATDPSKHQTSSNKNPFLHFSSLPDIFIESVKFIVLQASPFEHIYHCCLHTAKKRNETGQHPWVTVWLTTEHSVSKAPKAERLQPGEYSNTPTLSHLEIVTLSYLHLPWETERNQPQALPRVSKGKLSQGHCLCQIAFEHNSLGDLCKLLAMRKHRFLVISAKHIMLHYPVSLPGTIRSAASGQTLAVLGDVL